MKKLLIGAAMLAAMVFTSCMPDAIKQDGTIKYDNRYIIIEEDGSVKQGKEGKEGSIENTEWYYREIRASVFKHEGGYCTLSVNSNYDNTGNAGFIFGKKDNPDGTMDFGVATVNYSVKDGFRYYISWFKGVDLQAGYNKESNFNHKEEVQIVPESGVFKPFDDGAIEEVDGSYSVQVSVKAQEDGSYLVEFFEAGANIDDSNPLESYPVPSTVTGYTEKGQTDFGYYAMIKPGKSFEGKVTLHDYEKNPIPVYN